MARRDDKQHRIHVTLTEHDLTALKTMAAKYGGSEMSMSAVIRQCIRAASDDLGLRTAEKYYRVMLPEKNKKGDV